MVSRTDAQAFFGLPPKGVLPKGRDVVVAEKPAKLAHQSPQVRSWSSILEISLADKVPQSDKTITISQKELEAKDKEVEKLKAEVDALRNELTTSKEKYEAQEKLMIESSKKFEEDLKTKDKEISEALTQKERLGVLLLQAKTSAGAQREKVRDLDEQLRGANGRFHKAIEDFNAKQLELTEVQADSQTPQRSLDNINADLEAKTKEIKNLGIQIKTLTGERDSLSRDLKQAEDDIDVQAKFASRTLARRSRFPTAGMKRESDDLPNGIESDRTLKRAKIVPVITIKHEDAIDLAMEDEDRQSQHLSV
jgi:chromosome segregation ATPase